MLTHKQRASKRFKKRPNHFRVPRSSDQTSRVLCSEITVFLSAQWQAIPLSPVYQSVSQLSSDSSPPLSSWLLSINSLMLSIAPTGYHSISPTAYILPPPQPPWRPTRLSLSLSLLLYVDRWVTAVLNVRLSDRGHTGAPAAGGMPGDERWLHVPTASARWS